MACLEEWIFKVCIQNKRLRHKSELPLKRNLEDVAHWDPDL